MILHFRIMRKVNFDKNYIHKCVLLSISISRLDIFFIRISKYILNIIKKQSCLVSEPDYIGLCIPLFQMFRDGGDVPHGVPPHGTDLRLGFGRHGRPHRRDQGRPGKPVLQPPPRPLWHQRQIWPVSYGLSVCLFIYLENRYYGRHRALCGISVKFDP